MKPPMIVAEIGASHNGDLKRAIDTVRAAKRAGADAIKLQTFTADTMVANRTVTAKKGPWEGQNLWELYRRAAMPWEWQKMLFAEARHLGMVAFSTPFDETAVDFLETLGCPIYKIASMEITDLELIRYAAKTGKNMVISAGMATEAEMHRAMIAADNVNVRSAALTILKCTSSYPAPPSEMNVAVVAQIARGYDVRVGLSDHTIGPMAAVVATALGATMIEKHITLTRAGGLDDEFAALPDEFAVMVRHVREAAEVMGEPTYGPTESEREGSLYLRRGLWAAEDIPMGASLTPSNVVRRRPCVGIGASQAAEVWRHKASRPIKRGDPIGYEDVVK